MAGPFNIVIVAQSGRLSYESLLFLASLRHFEPEFPGRIFVAIPEKNGLWTRDPAVKDEAILALYARFKVEVVRFQPRHFGQDYPIGNKIECLAALPEGEPFLFMDTDTLVMGKLSGLKINFKTPSASMNRQGTWPKPELYKAGYAEIWKALYDRFGLDFESSLDTRYGEDDWQRYLYFNAGWFYGPCPVTFGARFADYAAEIRDRTPYELAAQSLYPWLDQIALPLVVHSFGGGRPKGDAEKLDGKLTYHWRAMPLVYAEQRRDVIELIDAVVKPNWLKKVLKTYEPFRDYIWRKKGEKLQEIFPLGIAGMSEKIVRNRIKNADLWMR